MDEIGFEFILLLSAVPAPLVEKAILLVFTCGTVGKDPASSPQEPRSLL